MKLLARLLFCCAVLLFASNLRAQGEEKPQDAEGCKDSPLITRFPGSTIHSCENKEYEQADFPLGTDKDGATLNKHVEGDFHSWDIGTRPGTSQIQVFRNFQAALKNAGFAIDYTNSPGEIVAHKGDAWIYVNNKGEFYYQTIVTEKRMQQEVTSEKILSEIAKLVQQNADLKLRVEGHTDNQGNAAANQTLSEKRAQAVVAWLSAHNVPAARLTTKGLGQTQPVADNSSEDGRAKNRRVELVKQ